MTNKETESQQDPDEEIVKLYNINIKNLLKISKKASIIETNTNELFFIKKIDRILEKKYQYLSLQSICLLLAELSVINKRRLLLAREKE